MLKSLRESARARIGSPQRFHCTARTTPLFPAMLTAPAKTATNRANFVNILDSPFGELQIPQGARGRIDPSRLIESHYAAVNARKQSCLGASLMQNVPRHSCRLASENQKGVFQFS